MDGLKCYECAISDGQECVIPTMTTKVRNCKASIFTVGTSNESKHLCLKTVESELKVIFFIELDNVYFNCKFC